MEVKAEAKLEAVEAKVEAVDAKVDRVEHEVMVGMANLAAKLDTVLEKLVA